MEKNQLRQHLIRYVEENIGTFHQKRLNSLNKLNLQRILKRKNPYLYRAKNLLTSESIVRTILDAHLSSQEETLFGEFLEGLAILTCELTKGGGKSAAEGIDLELTENSIRYLVTIKSGPNWGNSSQIKKMKDNFKQARRVYGSNNPGAQTVCVNGCCYGIDDQPDKGDYLKYCGQRFWHFLSDDEDLYTEIIEPIAHRAKEKNDEFAEGYAGVINRLVVEFSTHFVHNGIINWKAILELNSKAKQL